MSAEMISIGSYTPLRLHGDSMKKSLLAMPVEVHSGFLQACPLMSREYVILKNSLVLESPTGQAIVEILCDDADAKLLSTGRQIRIPTPFRTSKSPEVDVSLLKAGRNIDRGTWITECRNCAVDFELEVKPGEESLNKSKRWLPALPRLVQG